MRQFACNLTLPWLILQRGNVRGTISNIGGLINNTALRDKYIALAIADYTEAIRLNPNSSFAYNNRGLIRRNSGDLQGAITDYTEAILLDPRYYNPYNNRGLARYILKDLRGALTDLDAAIRINPVYANAYLSRGAIRTSLAEAQGDTKMQQRATNLLKQLQAPQQT
jgi:tetratricopeptide (TPR) repeat protein